MWHLLKPILFYSGNTGDLIQRNDIEFNPDLPQNPQEKPENTATTHDMVDKQD